MFIPETQFFPKNLNLERDFFLGGRQASNDQIQLLTGFRPPFKVGYSHWRSLLEPGGRINPQFTPDVRPLHFFTDDFSQLKLEDLTADFCILYSFPTELSRHKLQGISKYEIKIILKGTSQQLNSVFTLDAN